MTASAYQYQALCIHHLVILKRPLGDRTCCLSIIPTLQREQLYGEVR